MALTPVQIMLITLTIVLALGGGIYAARSVHSAEGYSLGGRSAGVPMVAGTIAGTCIGGGATVGTAQLAGTIGLSAWWFTIGTGLALIVMGLFYARPLRGTALETITQYLVLNYGKGAGHFTTVVSSFGIFFSAVASCLPGIAIFAALTGMPAWLAALLFTGLVACYGFFGGLESFIKFLCFSCFHSLLIRLSGNTFLGELVQYVEVVYKRCGLVIIGHPQFECRELFEKLLRFLGIVPEIRLLAFQFFFRYSLPLAFNVKTSFQRYETLPKILYLFESYHLFPSIRLSAAISSGPGMTLTFIFFST